MRHPDLIPGDLGLVWQRGSFVPWAIQVFTGGPNHGLALVEPAEVIEASPSKGVHRSPLFNYDQAEMKWVRIVGCGKHVALPPDREYFVKRLLEKIGAGYDFGALGGFPVARLLRWVLWNPLQVGRRFFCFELLGTAAKEAGFPFVRERDWKLRPINPGLLTGRDILRSPIVQILHTA